MCYQRTRSLCSPGRNSRTICQHQLTKCSRVGEKFLDWADEPIPLETIIESVTLYWFTETLPRSIYHYREVRPVLAPTSARHCRDRTHLQPRTFRRPRLGMPKILGGISASRLDSLIFRRSLSQHHALGLRQLGTWCSGGHMRRYGLSWACWKHLLTLHREDILQRWKDRKNFLMI